MSATVVSPYVFHTKYVNTFMVYLFTEGQVKGSTASPKAPPPCFFIFYKKILYYFNDSLMFDERYPLDATIYLIL